MVDGIYDPDWLRQEMERRSIKTGQLAAWSGVSRSQIQRIRNGMAPRMDTLIALKTALASEQQVAA